MTQITGSCLCGNVSFKGDCEIKMAANCHCDDCRKATGSVFSTLVFVAKDELAVTGDAKTFNHTADSGAEMVKHFCFDCGSQVFGENSNRAGMLSIRAGTINEKNIIKPVANVYCSSAVPSTPMDSELKNFDKMPG